MASASIKGIAAAAGVSVGTVSKMFIRPDALVSEAELGAEHPDEHVVFHPELLARSSTAAVRRSA